MVLVPRQSLAAVGRVLAALDKNIAVKPRDPLDAKAWDDARALLFGILERNGYELCEPCSARIKKVKKGGKS